MHTCANASGKPSASANTVGHVIAFAVTSAVAAFFYGAVSSWFNTTVVVALIIIGVIAQVGIRSVTVKVLSRKVAASRNAPQRVENTVESLAGIAGVTVTAVSTSEAEKKTRTRPLPSLGENPKPGTPTAGHNAAWVNTGNRRGVMLVGEHLDDDVSILVGVVAHELGHGYHRHAYKSLIAHFALSFMQAFVIVTLLGSSFLTLWVAVFGIKVVRRFVKGAISRSHERQADRFAIKLVGTENVVALMELFESNGFGQDEPGWADNLFRTHPTTDDRLAATRALSTAGHHSFDEDSIEQAFREDGVAER